MPPNARDSVTDRPKNILFGFRHHIVFTDFTVLGPCLECAVAALVLAFDCTSKKLGNGKVTFIWGLCRVWGRLGRHVIVLITADVGHEGDRKVISS